MKKGPWPGTWKVACQVCGIWYTSKEIKKRWDGVLACPKDWETRHPQTLIKIRSETVVPPFVSKDASPDEYVLVCDVVSSSAYAGLGTAGCMKASNTQVPYQTLLEIYTNGHGDL